MIRQPALNRAVLQLMVGATVLIGASAQAQSHVSDLETGQSVSVQSSVSRAEVLADLKIYQESGLAARERYAALRHGQRYAALVAEYAARRGTKA